jgi:thioredoxin-dependent peroxiredoxin
MLKEGDKAPDIKLETDSGETVSLSKFKGKKIVLYFYPKADTPGCTVEACEFRDLSKQFAKKNVVIIGVSPDTVKSQAKFKGKFDLPFSLLADVDKSAAEAYGVWQEKNMYGKKVMGIVRSTFLIGEDGKISKIFSKVKAQGHAEEVLSLL